MNAISDIVAVLALAVAAAAVTIAIRGRRSIRRLQARIDELFEAKRATPPAAKVAPSVFEVPVPPPEPPRPSRVAAPIEPFAGPSPAPAQAATAPTGTPGPFGPLIDALTKMSEMLRGYDSRGVGLSSRPGDLADTIDTRVGRLRHHADANDPEALDDWVRIDLLPLLDLLARAHTDATRLARGGASTPASLAAEMEMLVFGDLSPATRHSGFFALDPIQLYKTPFDPDRHHAQGKLEDSGAPNTVVGVASYGRLEAKTGALREQARVIVGR